jgi:hypothetical protein
MRKAFVCPECNNVISSNKAWFLTPRSVYICPNCKCHLYPERAVTRLIAVLVSVNCSILVVIFGFLGFRYQGPVYGIIYGIIIGIASFVLLYFLNKRFVVFNSQVKDSHC